MTDATDTPLRYGGVETDQLLQRLRCSNTACELCVEAAGEIERMRDLITRVTKVLREQPESLAPVSPETVVDVAISAAASEAVQLARALRIVLPFAEDPELDQQPNGIEREDAVAMGRRALGERQDH